MKKYGVKLSSARSKVFGKKLLYKIAWDWDMDPKKVYCNGIQAWRLNDLRYEPPEVEETWKKWFNSKPVKNLRGTIQEGTDGRFYVKLSEDIQNYLDRKFSKHNTNSNSDRLDLFEKMKNSKVNDKHVEPGSVSYKQEQREIEGEERKNDEELGKVNDKHVEPGCVSYKQEQREVEGELRGIKAKISKMNSNHVEPGSVYDISSLSFEEQVEEALSLSVSSYTQEQLREVERKLREVERELNSNHVEPGSVYDISSLSFERQLEKALSLSLKSVGLDLNHNIGTDLTTTTEGEEIAGSNSDFSTSY